jgi:hypothetical protein
MKQRGESVRHAGSRPGRIPHGQRFWDEVEQEIEALDWHDLAEFLAAEHGPFEPAAEFREDLRAQLLAFVRSRYSV